MTISLLLTSIMGEIDNLSVTGVTIKSYDTLSASWQGTPNILYPNPEGFLTNLRLDYQSFPHGAGADVNISYTLNYRFLGTLIGSNIFVGYPAMVDKVVAVINAIITNHSFSSGAASVELAGVTFGARSDPSGNMYHGADIALSVVEMQNP